MDTSRIKLLYTPPIGSGLQLCPVEINAQYREEWQTKWSLCCLTLDGKLVSETLYSTPGPGITPISKGNYYLLHKYVEAVYNDDIMKMAWKEDYKKHNPKHHEALYVIIDKNGQEKVQFEKFQTPYLIPNSCIYILGNSYYNIETNELYAPSFKDYLDSDEFVFIKNEFDKDIKKRGVLKINKLDGSYELYHSSK